MRVLFIGPLPEPVTGQALACQVLYEHLAAEHRLELVDLNKGVLKQGISSVGRVLQIFKIMAAVWRKRSKADVVYLTISQTIAGNFRDLMIYALCFSRLPNMVIHLHGGAGMRNIMRGRRLLSMLNRFFLRRAGAIVVLGRKHTDIFAGVVNPERLHVVPNFAQDYLFTNVDSIRQKFAQPRPLKVLFLSNLLPGKGHIELLEAYLSLDAKFQAEIQIDFAGAFESPSQEQAFRQRIASFSGLRYHGVVDGARKRELFASAHVFCLPTYYPYEGQPISILEAYASGCYVVTTDHSGIGDIFTEGLNGRCVPARSVDALRRVLRDLVEGPERLEPVALNNLRIASEEYRAETHVKRLKQVLRAVRAAASNESFFAVK